MQSLTLPTPAPLGPEVLARALVETLVQLGRDDMALHVANRQRLVTDDQLVEAWETGADPLARFRQAVAL